MAQKRVKTEHNGPKRGRGAFWGPRQEAKKESNRKRRTDDKRAARGEA